MSVKWKNWSGSVSCSPLEMLDPKSENEIQGIVLRAREEQKKIRVVGTGHSFSKLVSTDSLLISLDEMQGVISHDDNSATVWGGTKLKQLGSELYKLGLAQENMGDIDVQSIAGALSTGTHGTGEKLGTLSTQILEITYINGNGEVVKISRDEIEKLAFAKLSLGLLGIITRVRLRLDKTYLLHEVTRKERLTDCLANWESYLKDNRNFEFFWFPHTDTVQTKFLNVTDKKIKEAGWLKRTGDLVIEHYFFLVLCKIAQWIPSFSKRVAKISAWGIGKGEAVNYSHQIYATSRNVRFNEMEYNVPIEHFEEVLLELKAMIEKDNVNVFFPIECRFVQEDEIALSPAYKRNAAYIAVHRFNGCDFKEYFEKAEKIFKKYDGRPHWGKINFLDREYFKSVYPQWDKFESLRAENDPNRIFINGYLENIFSK